MPRPTKCNGCVLVAYFCNVSFPEVSHVVSGFRSRGVHTSRTFRALARVVALEFSACFARRLYSLRRSCGTIHLPRHTLPDTTAMGATLSITAACPSINMVPGINQVGPTAAWSTRSYHKRRHHRRRRRWITHHPMTLSARCEGLHSAFLHSAVLLPDVGGALAFVVV